MSKTIKTLLSFIAAFSIAGAQMLFAEPPDTKWTVTGGSTLTITEQVESGTPWIFTLPKAGGRLDRFQKGSATKLNLRTIVPLLPSGCKITYVQEGAFKNNADIEELYWPDTITTISKNSFLSCSKLKICDYPEGVRMMKTVVDLGYDLVPGTTSLWGWHLNPKETMLFCKKNIDPEHLAGFMVAPWMVTIEKKYYSMLGDAYTFYHARNDIFGM